MAHPPDDLFASALEERLARQAPLAARMRPRSLDEVVGPGLPAKSLNVGPDLA